MARQQRPVTYTIIILIIFYNSITYSDVVAGSTPVCETNTITVTSIITPPMAVLLAQGSQTVFRFGYTSPTFPIKLSKVRTDSKPCVLKCDYSHHLLTEEGIAMVIQHKDSIRKFIFQVYYFVPKSLPTGEYSYEQGEHKTEEIEVYHDSVEQAMLSLYARLNVSHRWRSSYFAVEDFYVEEEVDNERVHIPYEEIYKNVLPVVK